MAAPPDEGSLESRISNPQLATRLLAHKIQSPQEWEAMQALMYLGSRAPEPVKKKVLEMMYSWTVGFPEENKICDAYQMLKKQGIVKQDPALPDDKPLPPPPPRPKNAIFEDEEKSKDQKRMEKVSKRVNAIQEVKESVKLLTQLLADYSKDTSSHDTEELIKDLYQRCEKMRPTLFRLASDTEDNDEALAEILQANDSLTQVINLYRQLVKGEEVNGDSSTMPPLKGKGTALLDLTGLDTSPSAPTFPEFPSQPTPSHELGISLLDDELMSLGLTDNTPSSTLASSQSGDASTWNSFQISETVDTPVPQVPAAVLMPSVTTTPASVSAPISAVKALDELDVLGKTLLQQSLPPESLQVKWDKLQPQSRPTLRDLQSKSNPSPSPILVFSSESANLLNSQHSNEAFSLSIGAASTPQDEMSLANVTVPLESIKPSSMLPVTIFDKHSLRVLMHFARESPPSRPDVLVVIISMLSSAPMPVTNIRFQAAVPKNMRVKLQPPSGTDLPAFNPILPPAAITQVLLLANPQKEKVRLRYKLTFDLADDSHDESGDIEQFPPPESWGNL
ncbi:ADP-ribosylation factor-binding protein GGA1 [Bagarius yarrelli]|uniref:ADP-ribosylation factor-binding protein GGA1 n=1 Tax=Bagarius yarrelli TaxID=175774 RepID=A0A556TTI0_BAGYA|nr:ADP-ribosylation factor-binding protein GGA1 [Bagarius yarrelli]